MNWKVAKQSKEKIRIRECKGQIIWYKYPKFGAVHFNHGSFLS
jgi:hypothetical protein